MDAASKEISKQQAATIGLYHIQQLTTGINLSCDLLAFCPKPVQYVGRQGGSPRNPEQ